MKRKRTLKVEVVQSYSPDEFSSKLNELFARLAEDNIKFTDELFNNGNGFSAFVRYEDVEQIPECLMDEYHIKGIFPKCKDCEFYEPINSYEGKCFKVRGTLRRTDDVGECQVFWERMEAKEQGEMYGLLRQEIKAQFKNYYKFCEKVGYNASYFSAKLNGIQRFNTDDKVRILRGLGIEISEENLEKYFKGE